MLYKELRPTIKTGDLFFTAWNALFSRLIRSATRSKVSHTGIFIWLGKRLFIVESVEGVGVRIMPASQYIKSMNGKIWTGRIKNPKYTEEEILDRVFSDDDTLPKIGEEYDMAGALLSLFWDTKSKQVFCSEYVKKIEGISFVAKESGMTPVDVAEKTSGLTIITYK